MATISNQNTTKVFVQSYLELLRATGKDYQAIPNSTLNQKLGISHAPIWPPTGSGILNSNFPIIKYMAIGSGGHAYQSGGGASQGTIKTKVHDSIHCAMYKQMPFAVRPLDEDFTPAERAEYRLREVKTIDGVQYAFYWLKVIDLNAITPTLRVVHIENGEIIEEWDYDPEDRLDEQLNPEVIDISNVDVNTVNGLHLMVKSQITVELNASQLAEIVTAMAVLHPGSTVDDATISEVAVVWGFDFEKNISEPQPMIEAAGAQIISHITTHVALRYHNNLIRLSYGLADGLPVLTDIESI